MTGNELLNILSGGIVAFVAIVVLFFWGSREAKRKKELRRQEAEKIANLPPELQQLHIYANQQTQQFEFSFILFFLSCFFIAALIYILNWSSAT